MQQNLKIRPEILDFSPYEPGLSISEIKKKYNLSTVIKLASNENPLGCSPLVEKVLQSKACFSFRYPRAGSPDLTYALAEYHQIPKECIVPGNGSDEIIDLLLRVKPRPGQDNIVLCQPSFSIYRLQAKLCGVRYKPVPLRPDFGFDWQALKQAVDANTALVFLTSPDNPSGHAASRQDLFSFCTSLPKDCLLVLDEAYIDFVPDLDEYSLISDFSTLPNLVILRTFSKMFGLAGLRLGYGIMPKLLAQSLLKVKLPFSLNILAEKAGIAALKDRHFYQATWDTVNQGRIYLLQELNRLNCKPLTSRANFVLFSPPLDTYQVHNHLLQKGVIVRPLKSYGLDEFLRVSIGTEQENKIFINYLEQILTS